MATGTAVFLIALGAILAFAVEADVAGLDIATIGVILMVAGLIGLVVSLFWLDRMTGRRSSTHTVVEDAPLERRVVEDRPHVVEETRTTRHTI